MMKVFVFCALLAITQAAFTGDVNAFCAALQTSCNGTLMQYADAASCVASMNGLVTMNGTDGETSGNTKACRIYHGGAPVQSDPMTHCIHAGSTGGDACGTLHQVYCDQLQAFCPMEIMNAAMCHNVTRQFLVGMFAETMGNTLHCRLYHLRAAASLNMASVHCPHAGYLGGGQCGSTLEGYCSTIQAACTGANQQYGTYSACMAIAPSFPAGTTGETSGNTLGCRAYHAGAALTDPMTHCKHAGPTGGGACGIPCDAFCSVQTYACKGPDMQYADTPTCMTACAGFPTGVFGATTGNTLDCRFYHVTAGLSLNQTSVHCPHSRADGFDVAHCAAAATMTKPTSNAGPAPTGDAASLFLSLIAMIFALFI